MKRPEDYCATIIEDTQKLAIEDRISYLRGIVVPLIEHLGYTLAHAPKDFAATSTFVLATDIEKRLTALEQAVFPQGPVQC